MTLLRLPLLAVLAARVLLAQGLPPVPVPPENPQTPAKVVLGKILFFEEQLGRDYTTACATCHMPEVGGGDPRALSPLNVHPGMDGIFGTGDDIRGSRGVVRCNGNGQFADDGTFFPNPQVTARKASPAIGAAWDPLTFWDGRAGPEFKDPVTQQVLIPSGGALEAQAALPPTSGEMGCQGTTLTILATRLQTARPMRLATALPADIALAISQNPTYPALFNDVFGDPAITPARIAMAMAAYERVLVPDQTPWDAFMAGQTTALTPNQQLGWSVFQNACTGCHVPPLFTNHGFHNVGVRPPLEDTGRMQVTMDPLDRGKFKTPGLRNVGLRAPYFHNGGKASLLDVVNFYNQGADFSDNLDPNIQPLGLSWPEVLALVDFLENGLTDPRVALAQAPFDRPILRSELAQSPLPFGARTAGTGNVAPRMMAPTPPMIGAERFGIGVAHGLGAAFAVLGISFQPASPGATLLGVPLYITIDSSTLQIPFNLAGVSGAAGEGHASIVFPIPDVPLLAGITVYAQWIVLDTGGATGLAASEGLVFTFEQP